MPKSPTREQVDTYNEVRRSFKRIEDYTDEELAAVIAVVPFNHSIAYELLNFVDCYFEKRRRKQAKEHAK